MLRFTCSVFPSEDDDVVTSPYNALLALDRLLDSAHCVFPVENQALLDICALGEQQARRQEARVDSTLAGEHGKGAGQAAGCMAACWGGPALLPVVSCMHWRRASAQSC